MKPVEHFAPRLVTFVSACTFVFSACGPQDPAFTENVSGNYAPKSSVAPGGVDTDDATAATGGDGTDISGAGGSSGSGDGGSAGGGAGGDSTASGDGANGSGGDGSGMGTPGDEGGFGLTKITQNFVQQNPGKVDILWVIDTSASMAEEQNYLGSNFNAFITGLASQGVDFQTAVTTTDVCDDDIPAELAARKCPVDFGGSPATHLRGSFVGDAGHRVLKQGDSDLVSRFNTYVNQGINGSNFEHGLKAAEMAVAKSKQGSNEALVRDGAFLSVIVVSDEEDDGIGLGMVDAYTNTNFVAEGLTSYRYTDEDFVQSLQDLMGGDKFSVSTITGTKNSSGALCSAPHSQPREEGSQYIKAAEATGGIVQSICDTNWTSLLQNIGKDVNAQSTQLMLSHVPDAATIKVFVNDVMKTHWSYNPANNAVKFDAEHVPATGAQVRIEYFKK